MGTLRNAQLIVSEILYDSLKRPVVSTVPVVKQEDPASSSNASQFGFVSDFVSSRDPQQSTSTWLTGGELTGSITSWVDPTSFCLPQDPNYAYQGIYYETDPTSRKLQSSKSGVTFKRSTFSNPGYSESYYADYFPQALYSVLPPSQIQIPNATGEDNSFTSPNSFPYMPMAAQQTSIGTLGLVTQASWADTAGRLQAKATVDANNHTILQSLSYQTGASLSNGLASNSTSSCPIMNQKQIYLPNFFDTSVENQDSFYIQKQMNALGQVVQTLSPDQGITVYYTDIFGRLRYSQTADQLTAGMIQYSLYDALNRVIEVGLYPGTWDVASFQQNTLMLATPRPAQAQVQKSITYDQLPDSLFLSTTQGKVVHTLTFPLLAGNTTPLASTAEFYQYDSWGRVIKVTQEIIPLQEDSPFVAGSYATQYTYNGLSKVLQITYPSNFAVNYGYNLQGLPNQVTYMPSTESSESYSLAFYTYNANNQIAAEIFFDGKASTGPIINTYTYGNSLNQLTDINTLLVSLPENQTPSSSGPVIPDLSPLFNETLCYTNDPTGDNTQGTYQDGNIQLTNYTYFDETDTQWNYQISYAYDTFGRLYGASVSPAGWGPWAGFGDVNLYGTFDANGNYLTNLTYTAGTNQVSQATVSAQRNTYTTATLTYTDSGLTASMTYTSSSENNPSYTLKIASDLITQRPLLINLTDTDQTSDNFLYDRQGERIQKILSTNSSSSAITYVRGKDAQVLAEYDEHNTPQTYYIHGPLGIISLYDPNAQQNSFIIKDHLGSTRLVYNASTNQASSLCAYDCFGNLFNGFNTTTFSRYLYTGQEWDQELVLYNYHARQYDPFYTRRFLSPDPAHQFPSPYTYCANNPINYKDDNGKMMSFFGLSSSSNSRLPSNSPLLNNSNYYWFDDRSLELIRNLPPTNDPKGGGLTGIYNRRTGELVVRNYTPIQRTGSTYQIPGRFDAGNGLPLLGQKAVRREGSAHEVMASDFYWSGSTHPTRLLRSEEEGNPWPEHFDFSDVRGWSILRLHNSTANPGGENYIVRFGSLQLNLERPETTGRFMGAEDRIGIMTALRNQGGFRNIMYTFEPNVQSGMGVTSAETSIINYLRA